jgi:hypothetical protein
MALLASSQALDGHGGAVLPAAPSTMEEGPMLGHAHGAPESGRVELDVQKGPKHHQLHAALDAAQGERGGRGERECAAFDATHDRFPFVELRGVTQARAEACFDQQELAIRLDELD